MEPKVIIGYCEWIGGILDISLRSINVPSKYEKFATSELLSIIVELVKIAKSYGATFYLGGPAQVSSPKNEILVVTSLIFKNSRAMRRFLNDTKDL